MTRAALYLGAALLSSCSFVVDTCACTLVPPHGVITGTLDVLPPASALPPILSAAWRPGSCGSSAATASPSREERAVQPGQYRFDLTGSEGVNCATLTVQLGQRIARDSGNVTLRAAAGPQATDTLRIDLVLP